MSTETEWLNGKDLAIAMFHGSVDSNRGEWTIYGVKKANKLFAAQGKEALIFTGRLSTISRVSQWLSDHPEFVPNQILAPVRKKPAKLRQGRGSRDRQTRPQRQPAAA